MRMLLLLMIGLTRQDIIWNERNGEKNGVGPLVEKMVETCLKWFRRVRRRLIEYLVRRVDQIVGRSFYTAEGEWENLQVKLLRFRSQ